MATQSTPSFIAYYRVSTARQGLSGLGLEGQQAAVKLHAKVAGSKILRGYTEVESGKRSDRPELVRALAHCRRSKATLIIAKLDRLTRNVRFLLTLVESGADVFFCDLPSLTPGPQGRFILTMFAAVAELEAGMISQRTKTALAAYKARGGLLGSARPGAHRLTGGANPKAAQRAGEVARANADDAYEGLAAEIGEVIEELTAELGRKPTLTAIADALTGRGHTTRRGRPWNKVQVKRVLDRIKP